MKNCAGAVSEELECKFAMSKFFTENSVVLTFRSLGINSRLAYVMSKNLKHLRFAIAKTP